MLYNIIKLLYKCKDVQQFSTQVLSSILGKKKITAFGNATQNLNTLNNSLTMFNYMTLLASQSKTVPIKNKLA